MTDASDRFNAFMDRIEQDRALVQATRLDTDAWELELRVDGGRTQLAVVALVDGEEEPQVAVFSFISPANPDFYEAALRTNANLEYGRVALVEHRDATWFAVVDTSPLDELDTDELMHAIDEVAASADALEAAFTGADDQ